MLRSLEEHVESHVFTQSLIDFDPKPAQQPDMLSGRNHRHEKVRTTARIYDPKTQS